MEPKVDEAEQVHAGGRPTKYDPAIVQKLIAAFQRDFTVEEACHYSGIAKQTFYNWTKEHPELLDDIERAKTYLFRKSKEVIIDDIVTNKDSKAAQWYLSKRHVEYNPRLQVALEGEVEVKSNKDADLLEIIKLLAAPEKKDDTGQPNTEPEAGNS